MATDDRIDLDRVITDPDYRRATIRRLNAAARAAPARAVESEAAPAPAADLSTQNAAP